MLVINTAFPKSLLNEVEVAAGKKMNNVFKQNGQYKTFFTYSSYLEFKLAKKKLKLIGVEIEDLDTEEKDETQ